MSSAAPSVVTVFGREDCHLCEQLRAELEPLRRAYGFEVLWVDVDGDAALARRYGHKVPVVSVGRTQVCHFFLDAQALEVELALQGLGPAPTPQSSRDDG